MVSVANRIELETPKALAALPNGTKSAETSNALGAFDAGGAHGSLRSPFAQLEARTQ